MSTKIVRTIGMTRARMKIGMQNLAYKLRRFVTLERIATARREAQGARDQPRIDDRAAPTRDQCAPVYARLIARDANSSIWPNVLGPVIFRLATNQLIGSFLP